MANPVRLEVEDFDNRPAGFRVETLNGIASDNEALKIAYKSQGGPNAGQPITTSTQFTGASGTYDVALGTFDESGGNSRVVVTIGGVVAADFRLDENPGGGSPSAGTKVERAVAAGLTVNNGDTVEITVYRDGGEYVRLDYVDFDPVGPAGNPVGPVTDTDGAANEVPEDAAAGTPVGITALASDPDASDSVSYSVNDPRFQVDANGVVTVAPGYNLDTENEPEIPVTVTATSTDGSTSQQTFTVTIKDVDEFDANPVIDLDTVANRVAENAAAGTEVGITAYSHDSDATDTISFSIDDARFAIDPSTGKVTVAPGASFDADGEPQVEVEITATSTDGSSAVETFVIDITEEPPPPSDPIRLEAEDFDDIPGTIGVAAIGVASEGEVQQVKYKSQGGPDNNAPVTSSTSYSGPDGQFDLFYGGFDESDGDSRIVIAVNGNEVADFLLDQDPGGIDPDASTAVRRLVAEGIDVEDGDEISVTIYRNDSEYTRFDYLDLVPQGPANSPVGPVADTNGDANEVAEDAAAGTGVGITALASDPDGGDSVSYSVDDTRFEVDAGGVVTVATGATFDAETEQTVNVTVTATSTDGSNSQETFTINVTDVNEFGVSEPVDTDPSANTVAEGAAAGTPIGIVAFAEDPDVSDSIASYSSVDPRFTVDPDGTVRVAPGAVFDATSEQNILLPIEATSTDGSSDLEYFNVVVTEEPPPPSDPIRLEAEDFDDIPGTIGVAAIGVASEGEVQQVKYKSQGGPDNNAPVTSSTSYSGPDGQFDLFYGGFDESDGDSRIVIAVNGNEVADFLLDQDPGGIDPDASTAVRRLVAEGIDVEDGDEISVTIYRNDSEYTRFDYLDLVPQGPANSPVGPVADTNGDANEVAEDAAAGTGVGITALASDPDGGDSVSYSVDDTRFEVDAGGVVTVANGATFDAETEQTVNVTVTATSTDGSNSQQTFTIGVTDVDEFDVGAVTDSDGTANGFSENAATGTTVGITASAVDADISDTVSYSIDDTRFSIDGNGVVTVLSSGAFDADGEPEIDVIVTATSTDGSSSQETFTIQVAGVNDGPVGPVSDADGATNEIAEDAGENTLVGITAQATDPDGSDTISYSVDDNRFTVDANGVVRVAAGANFDAETEGTVTVQVTATSSDTSTSFENFDIDVTDVDEFDVGAVTDSDGAANGFSENAATGTTVGITAVAVDADISDTVSYSVDDNRFSVDANGVVTVLSSGSFDADGEPEINVTVTATSTDGSFSQETFTIQVAGVNDGPVGPVTDADGSTNEIAEDAAEGTAVGITAQATDPDGSDSVSYSVDDARFTVDANGVVRVAAGANFDAETEGTITIQVTATSSDTSTSFENFDIDVTDIDEFDVGAVTDSDGTANGFSENAATGTTVGITASAVDADISDTVSYSVDDNRFSVDANGVVTVLSSGAFDADGEPEIDVIVTATSTDGSSSQETFTIQVAGVNDGPVGPVTDADSATNEIAEDAGENTLVGITAQATDPDGSDTISYSVDDNRFTVDANGVVRVAAGANFDAETEGTVTIQVTATSSDTSTSFENFDIGVTDVDEFDVGAVTDTDAAPNIMDEDAATGTTVGITVSAVDADISDTVSYSISDNRFSVDGNGVVRVLSSGSFDAQTESEIDVTVTATSTDGSSSQETFTIDVTGDPPPPAGPPPVAFKLADLDGTNGSAFFGVSNSDLAGDSVSGAGDFNGDGFDDFIIGATEGGPGAPPVGEAYLVFGTAAGYTAGFDLSSLDGTNGFRIDGATTSADFGRAVGAVGDLNKDGYADVIVGAPSSTTANGSSGEAYVIYGASAGFGASFDVSTLDGSNGFAVSGLTSGSGFGKAVSAAGDLNGDGWDDFIIGASDAHAGDYFSGTSFVIFGSSAAFGATLDISGLDGSNGFEFQGLNEGEGLGKAVSAAGDVNGDGLDDLIIGAYRARPGGNQSAGEAYVVFGSTGGFSAVMEGSDLDGSNGFRIPGLHSAMNAGVSVSGGGDINGDGIADLIVGALGADYNGQASGSTYVVFGSTGGFSAEFDLEEVDGTDGFRIDGGSAGIWSSYSVSVAGDVNGDGIDDVLIGAHYASPDGNEDAGEAYIVFGSTSGFSATLNLADLDGSNGYRIDGINQDDVAGRKVKGAGDVNGDGYDDLIVGARRADNGGLNAGEAYLIYGGPAGPGSADPGYNTTPEAEDATFANVADAPGGTVVGTVNATDADVGDTLRFSIRSGNEDGLFAIDEVTGEITLAQDVDDELAAGRTLQVEVADNKGYVDRAEVTIEAAPPVEAGPAPAAFHLSELDGSNGFQINGVAANDYSGTAVSDAGDFNGDGIDDVIIGAGYATRSGREYTGEAYVVFGTTAGFSASLDLASLNGTNGLKLLGRDAYDNAGIAVSAAGDINGDGIDDIIVGASGAYNSGYDAGESYVVFGSTGGFGATLNLGLLNGSGGFRLPGTNSFSKSGYSVSAAGDFNGDGIDDLIIGALESDVVASNAGEAYVVFGSTDAFGASVTLSGLDGDNGFSFRGGVSGDRIGSAVSHAGDVNGDGIDDVIIGARGMDNVEMDTGVAFVLFGSTAGFSSVFDIGDVDGSRGFAIRGDERLGTLGNSVSGAGDVNGDGIDDIIIGARRESPGGVDSSGASYVVFGSTGGFAATLDVSELDGSNGFQIRGVNTDDYSGVQVSRAGDFNGDGIEDLIIGANLADPAGLDRAGEAYLLFGSDGGFASSISLADLDGSNGFRIDGSEAGDHAGISVSGAGDLNGDGFDDLIVGAWFGDGTGAYSSGESYVLFGGPAGPGSADPNYNATPEPEEGHFAISEDAINGTTVGTVEATDPDASDSLSFSIRSGNDDGLFTIDETSGEIFTAAALDHETAPAHKLVVEVVDDQGYVARTDVTIAVRDQVTDASADAKTVAGTEEEDLLVGGLGDDTLTGLAADDRFVISEGDDTILDFVRGEDTVGLEGLLQGVSPADIADYVELTAGGPNAVFSFDEDGAGDFTVGGREGTLTLDGVDLTGQSLQDLLDDGTLWVG